MKILIAPNAFKGSLSAGEAAKAMKEGALLARPDAECICVPVSDGGDGLVEVVAEKLKGEFQCATVTGPRGRPVESRYFWQPHRRTAVIEMAKASGLNLLSIQEQDPCLTTTRGFGELMIHARGMGARRMILGLGGSATCDGGCGMASALGVRFKDEQGRAMEPTGGTLDAIARFDASGLDPAWKKIDLEVICDVSNTLLGEEGAARVYTPQKGASKEQVEKLEKGMAHLAELVKSELGIDMTRMKGGGAAGGLGAGLFAFLGAELRPGSEAILDLLNLSHDVRGSDLVLIGEGRMDGQTLFGKAPAGVAALAKREGIPCLAVTGSFDGDLEPFYRAGITAIHPLCSGSIAPGEAIAEAAALVASVTCEAIRAFMEDA